MATEKIGAVISPSGMPAVSGTRSRDAPLPVPSGGPAARTGRRQPGRPARHRTGMTMNPFRRRNGPRVPPDSDVTRQLEAAHQRIRELEAEVDRTRRDAGRLAAQRAGATLDELAEQIATSLAHLATQAELVRAGGSVLSAQDLATTATGLIRGLDRAGIRVDGAAGIAARFDPELHTPLGGPLRRDAPVLIRSPAVLSAGGRVVQKGTVEPLESGPK